MSDINVKNLTVSQNLAIEPQKEGSDALTLKARTSYSTAPVVWYDQFDQPIASITAEEFSEDGEWQHRLVIATSDKARQTLMPRLTIDFGTNDPVIAMHDARMRVGGDSAYLELASPDGSYWTISVDDDGNISSNPSSGGIGDPDPAPGGEGSGGTTGTLRPTDATLSLGADKPFADTDTAELPVETGTGLKTENCDSLTDEFGNELLVVDDLVSQAITDERDIALTDELGDELWTADGDALPLDNSLMNESFVELLDHNGNTIEVAGREIGVYEVLIDDQNSEVWTELSDQIYAVYIGVGKALLNESDIEITSELSDSLLTDEVVDSSDPLMSVSEITLYDDFGLVIMNEISQPIDTVSDAELANELGVSVYTDLGVSLLTVDSVVSSYLTLTEENGSELINENNAALHSDVLDTSIINGLTIDSGMPLLTNSDIPLVWLDSLDSDISNTLLVSLFDSLLADNDDEIIFYDEDPRLLEAAALSDDTGLTLVGDDDQFLSYFSVTQEVEEFSVVNEYGSEMVTELYEELWDEAA